MSKKNLLMGVVLAGVGFLVSAPTSAAGQASTHFNVFVPPNNNNIGRPVALIITALTPNKITTVDIVDDNADGDNDDTLLGITLSVGQSYVLFHKDGLVNDDAGGKWDGDYFKILANHPVVVQVATKSNWQHDWAPSDSSTQGTTGTSFFIFAPGTSGADGDVNIYSYSDNNQVSVKKISTIAASVNSSSKTQVDLSQATTIMSVTLSSGEDLVVRNNKLGLDILNPGETYWIQSQYPISVQYGHLGQVSGGNQARDGGGYIPSNMGNAPGDLFYFSIPHNPGLEGDKELRVASFDAGTTFTLFGFNLSNSTWEQIDSQSLGQNQTLDYVGNTNTVFKSYELYKATVSPSSNRVVLFEGNWLETGASGTSDFASAVPSDTGGAGTNFIAYLGPPGNQSNVAGINASISHLYAYSHDSGTQVTFKDLGTNGGVLNTTVTLGADAYFDLRVTQSQYNSMNIPSSGKRPYVLVTSTKAIVLVSENPNDNFMHSMPSILEAEPTVEILTSQDVLTCTPASPNSWLTINLDFGDTMTGTATVISLPPGFSYVPFSILCTTNNFGEPSVTSLSGGGQELTWTPGTMSGSKSFQIQVALDCSTVSGCMPEGLHSFGVLVTGTSGSEFRSSQSTRSVVVRRDPINIISNFKAVDNSATNEIDVSFDVSNEDGHATFRITRAPSPDSHEQDLVTLPSQGASIGTQYYEFSDAHACQSFYFYRIYATDENGCTSMSGPVTVTPESLNSSGGDGGVESKFSAAVLERSVMREHGGSYNIKTQNAALYSWLPLEGPGDTSGVDVTPHDLAVVGNAESVYSLDYHNTKGEVQATILLVETIGEYYEHSKAVCDRVKGGEVAELTKEPTLTGHVLRAQFTHHEEHIREFGMEFRLYENADQTYDVHSKWVLSEYPDPEPGQRVLNFQIWSKVAGYDTALLSKIFDELEIQNRLNFVDELRVSSSFIGKMRSQGRNLEFVVHNSYQPLDSNIDAFLRIYVLEESGSTYTYDIPTGFIKNGEKTSIQIDRGHSYNVDLIGFDSAEEILLDRVFVFDGGMVKVDDTYSSGSTEVSEYELFSCAGPETEGTLLAIGEEFGFDTKTALMYAGCGLYKANIDQFGGLTRRFLGGFGGFAADSFKSAVFWIQSNKDVNFCLLSTDYGQKICKQVGPQPAGAWVKFNLESFTQETITSAGESSQEYYSAEFTTTQTGSFELTVRGLSFFTESTNSEGAFIPSLSPAKIVKSTNRHSLSSSSSGSSGSTQGSQNQHHSDSFSSNSSGTQKKSPDGRSGRVAEAGSPALASNKVAVDPPKPASKGFFGCSTSSKDEQPTGATALFLILALAYLGPVRTKRRFR